MKDEIKEFIEFRIDEDGTYFYYNDKDNVEQWSYKLDDLKNYITNLQENYERIYNENCKARNLYLQELEKCNKNGTYVPKIAVEMFNVLEGNK